MLEEVVIVDALRTPIGKFKGSLQAFSAVELGTITVKELLSKHKIAPTQVDQVIFGNVLSAGLGQNMARQISLKAGLPYETTAFSVNEVCGSGMKAILLGQQAIQLGKAQVVIAGGAESMTQAPTLTFKDQAETTVESMMYDGLRDAFYDLPMGVTAEHLAEKFNVSRAEQDLFALESHQKAAKAQQEKKFDREIIAIETANGMMEADEGVRADSTLEKLASLRTIFKEDGTVTAANASSINDGAAAVMLMAKSYAEAQGIPYLATIEASSEVGVDPMMMGHAPYYAIKALLEQEKRSVADIDLFEINEAFAAQSIPVIKELGIPAAKSNIYGGAIALGHPIGASGARIVATLLSGLIQEGKESGIASLCIGGGLGLAMMIRKVG